MAAHLISPAAVLMDLMSFKDLLVGLQLQRPSYTIKGQFVNTVISVQRCYPRWQSSWGQHGAHLGPVGPRWAPCWPHEPCYQGSYQCRDSHCGDMMVSQVPYLFDCDLYTWERCFYIEIDSHLSMLFYITSEFYVSLWQGVIPTDWSWSMWKLVHDGGNPFSISILEIRVII